MFIPPGDTIHESLATSYVLVDALVTDLCEGGFSGVVEVVLRNTDSLVVIANGNVLAVIEKRTAPVNSGTLSAYTATTVEELSTRSRQERGRVSIHGYSARTASAVAARINATPLYVGLSNEFTDLEKMISKLVRERDREWFIEINTESGPAALIHMLDGQCRVIGSTDHEDSGALDGATNPALRYLIDECNGAGGTFDVYFTQTVVPELFEGPQPASSNQESAPMQLENVIVDEEVVASPVVDPPEAPSGWVTSSEFGDDLTQEPESQPIADAQQTSVEDLEQIAVSENAMAAAAASHPDLANAPEPLSGLSEGISEEQAEEISRVWGELPPPAPDAEAMAEIKRLMAEVARAIEEAAQAVGRPDSFSLSLRAGQLQIANRFPFLDPFAGEFEYLAGEIVFVGDANAEEFVEGLTEALKLAVEAVTASTAFPDRFRSYVNEDLQKLLARERPEFERFALAEVIPRVTSS